jgi:hypothetical protein
VAEQRAPQAWLLQASFVGHQGTWSLDASAKYGTAATPSQFLATGGGDEEDASAGFGNEGRGMRQARLQRHSLASRKRARAQGQRKWRWSPLEKVSNRRLVGNTVTAVLVGNVVIFIFILRNSKRMKVKGNRAIGSAVHRPRKRGVRMVGWPQCCISDLENPRFYNLEAEGTQLLNIKRQ